ncbi:MAG: carbon-nitrogen hydrolase family protein [Campylobacterales bacterium]|nr:carbon-nitrogen hydrolase family protein [Campylobacterales bacterium]
MKKPEISLYSLSFETTKNYNTNLKTLLNLIEEAKENSIIVAPEVCLTGFDYEHFTDACDFASIAIANIKKVSTNKVIILTMFEKKDGKIYNFAKVFYNGETIHEQAKTKLFQLGDEHKFMYAGDEKDIKIIEIFGLKIAILICFELRFKELWQKLEGADIIAVPSWWGKLRSENFTTLTEALAIMNQCYVIASDSANKECTAKAGIITPFGDAQRNGDKVSQEVFYSQDEIKKMRRYLNTGIK